MINWEGFQEIVTMVQALGKEATPEGRALLKVVQAFHHKDPCAFTERRPRGYTPEQCYMLFIHSALLQTSLEEAGKDLLRRGITAPLGEAVLDALHTLDVEQLVSQADEFFHYQWQTLPPEIQEYLTKQLVVSLDTVQHPYYGNIEKAQVIKGQKKASSMHHVTYGSAKVLWEGHGLTVAVRMLHQGQERTQWAKELLQVVNDIGKPMLILADGEFWVNELLADWYQQRLGWIVHVGGGTAHAKIVRELRRRAKTTQDIVTAPYPIFISKTKQWFTVQLIAWADSQGETYCIGVPDYLASLPPDWLVSLARNRFAAETGYRLWNALRPRTSSRQQTIRYALVVTAVALYNAYSLERTSPQLPHAPQSRHWRTLRQLVRRAGSDRSPLTAPPTPHQALKAARLPTAEKFRHIRPTRRRYDHRPVHRQTCSTGPLSKQLLPHSRSLTISGYRSLWFSLLTFLGDWVQPFLTHYPSLRASPSLT